MSVMFGRAGRACDRRGRGFRFTVGLLACLGGLVLGAGPVKAADTVSAPARELVLTDARLFHAAPRQPQSVWADVAKDGSRETVSLKTADGVTLRGWFYPARHPDAPYVITFHGNNEIIGDAYTQARDGFLYAQLDLNLITFDYRGTGFSDGAISLVQARADALAIYDFAMKKAAGRPVFVVGWSLGSVFASHVAGSRPSLAGLVLLDPMSSAGALATDVGQELHTRVVIPAEVAKGIRNTAELRNYRQPLLVVHGTADEVVPIDQGRADFAAAGSTDKNFVPVAGKNHVGAIWSVAADDAIAAFFAKHASAEKGGEGR